MQPGIYDRYCLERILSRPIRYNVHSRHLASGFDMPKRTFRRLEAGDFIRFTQQDRYGNRLYEVSEHGKKFITVWH